MIKLYIRSVVVLALLGVAANGICGVDRSGIALNDVRTVNTDLDGSSSIVVDVSGLFDYSSRRIDSAYLHLELSCTRVGISERASEMVLLAVLPYSRSTRVEEVIPAFEFTFAPGTSSPVLLDVTKIVEYWAGNDVDHSLEIFGADGRGDIYRISFSSGLEYAGWLEIRYAER